MAAEFLVKFLSWQYTVRWESSTSKAFEAELKIFIDGGGSRRRRGGGGGGGGGRL